MDMAKSGLWQIYTSGTKTRITQIAHLSHMEGFLKSSHMFSQLHQFTLHPKQALRDTS